MFVLSLNEKKHVWEHPGSGGCRHFFHTISVQKQITWDFKTLITWNWDSEPRPDFVEENREQENYTSVWKNEKARTFKFENLASL